jgi:formylmethanofuran dehydrogenase subunit B
MLGGRFILYWGGNPAECHPRHFTKYTLTQKGKFVPQGRKGGTMVLVDIRETPSARAADLFLQIQPGKDFELVTTLIALVKGRPVTRDRVAETGATVEQLQDLVDRMKRARFGVLFFGMGYWPPPGRCTQTGTVSALAIT